MQTDFVHDIHCHIGLHVSYTWPKEFENNMVTTCTTGSQMAEQLGNRAIDQKVAGSILAVKK